MIIKNKIMQNYVKFIFILIFTLILIISCNDQSNLSSSSNFNLNNETEKKNSINNNELYIDNNYQNYDVSYNKLITLYDILYFMQSYDDLLINAPEILYEFERRLLPKYWNEFTINTGIEIINLGNKLDLTFKEYCFRIYSGNMSDVFVIDNNLLPFYIRNNLIIPIDILIEPHKKNLGNLSYLNYYYQNYNLYALSISMKPDTLFIYNKNIIYNLGLNDPLNLWLNNNWTWDTWLELIITINNEINTYGFEVLSKSEFIELAFILGNGAKIIDFDENGYMYYAINEHYLNALHFINLVEEKYSIFNIKNATASMVANINQVKLINDGLNFMIYDKPNINKYIVNDDNHIEKIKFTINDDVNFVCVPRGPNLNVNISSRDYGNEACYVISSSCKDPESAVIFLCWLLMDIENYNERMNYFIENMYGGSSELFAYGQEWSRNSFSFIPFNKYDRVNFMFNYEFLQEFNLINESQLLNDQIVNKMQGIINLYINNFDVNN